MSGKTIELKTGGTPVGTFDYAISNGEMTLTNGINVGQSLTFLSPLAKGGSSGNSNNNGGGLSALVGEWFTKADDLAFEITSAGKLFMADTTYDVSVSGKTVNIKFGGTVVGTFDYAVNEGQMIMFNGTGIGITVAAFSPVVSGAPLLHPTLPGGGGNIDNPVLPGGGNEIDNPVLPSLPEGGAGGWSY